MDHAELVRVMSEPSFYGREVEGQYVRVCIPSPEHLRTDIPVRAAGKTWLCDFALVGVALHAVISAPGEAARGDGQLGSAAGRGALWAGTILFSQSVLLELYQYQTACCHDLPAPLAWLAASLLRLAGKDPEEAFPEGTWQFYVDYALREDSLRGALSQHNVDTLRNWISAHNIKIPSPF